MARLMIMCATKGHEKVPAVNTVTLKDGKDAPLCAECEARRYREMRRES
jgi:hypothetical protein